MKNAEVEKIKTNADLLMKIGGVVVMSNLFGGLASILLGFSSDSAGIEDLVNNPLSFVFAHFIKLCVTMIVIGILFIYGAYHLKRLRLKAIKILTWVSVSMIIMMWVVSAIVFIAILSFDATIAIKVIVIATAIVWSIPFVFLTEYINKKEVKQYFE